MKTIHTSTNLLIEMDISTGEILVTVQFHEESIIGRADGCCPRCGSPANLSLWEFEGPGGTSNTIWMTCGAEHHCELDGEVLRWTRTVAFDADWADQ